MRRFFARTGVVASLLALTLGVGAGSSGSAVQAPATTVIVQVLGAGKVTGPGVDCSEGSKTCYATFSFNSPVTLTAVDSQAGWTFDRWDNDTYDTDCQGSTSTSCTIPTDGGTHQITARFAASTSTATYTLTVGVPSNTGGRVTGGRINCGSGPSTACNWDVLTDSTITLVETPDAGYTFTGWGGSCIGTHRSCTISMTSEKSVTATFAQTSTLRTLTVTVTGGGEVTGGGIHCGPGSNCQQPEPAGAYVTLTATPLAGWTFTGWSGSCTGTFPTCTVQMAGDRAVTATFQQVFPLSVTVSGNGTVTGGGINCGSGGSICTVDEPAGSTVTLTASPASGASFVGWGGACTGTATTCTVVMTAARSVTATFSNTPPTPSTFLLTVTVSGNGTIAGGGINCGGGGSACSVNIAANATITLVATPGAGATFTGWGGACSGAATTCSVTMNASKSVTGTFSSAPATFGLTVTVSGSGTVTGPLIKCGNGYTTCFANENANATITLTATPAAGAKFQSWGGACTGTAATCQVVMNAAKTVTATFSKPPPRVVMTLNVIGRGSVTSAAGKCANSSPMTKTCAQVFTLGSRVTLRATPARGKKFLGWSGFCKGKAPTCTLVLSKPRTVTARFSK